MRLTGASLASVLMALAGIVVGVAGIFCEGAREGDRHDTVIRCFVVGEGSR